MNCCVVFRVLSVTSCRGPHTFFCGQERFSSDQVNLRFDAITIEIYQTYHCFATYTAHNRKHDNRKKSSCQTNYTSKSASMSISRLTAGGSVSDVTTSPDVVDVASDCVDDTRLGADDDDTSGVAGCDDESPPEMLSNSE